MSTALPALLTKLGIEVTASMPVIIEKIDRKLDECYSFSRPYKLPWPGLSVGFETIQSATVGARSFALQRGRLRGWFYRILERRNIFTTWYFVWGQYESEAAAVAQWEGFINLLRARELASQVLAR